MNMKKIMSAMALGAALTAPQLSWADTVACGGVACGAGVSTTIDFTVVIPGFIRFQLGAAAAVPTVTFDMTAAATSVGNSVAQSATADTNSGNGTAGDVNVVLQGNAAAATGLRISASGDAGTLGTTLGWASILVASGAINAPASDASSTGDNAYAGGVLNATDTWTYTYGNTAVVPAATYTGTLTYTVATY